MMSNMIEKKDRKQITKDWLMFFPEFCEYKAMHILRRNGPFLCGIHLQTYSSNEYYDVIFHIQNLMVHFPVIYFGTPTFLLNDKGAKEGISLVRHREGIEDITHRLKKEIKLLDSQLIELDDLVAYINKSVEQSVIYPDDSLRDTILSLFWFGKKDKAEKELMRAKEFIGTWPENVTRRFNGVEGWEKQVRELMNRDLLQKTVEQEIIKHKLEKYQDYGFIEK